MILDFDDEEVRRFYRLGFGAYTPGGNPLPDSLKNPVLPSKLKDAAEGGFLDAASGKRPQIPLEPGPTQTPNGPIKKESDPKPPDLPKPEEKPTSSTSSEWYRKGFRKEAAQPPTKEAARWYASGLRDAGAYAPSRIPDEPTPTGSGWVAPVAIALGLFGVAAIVASKRSRRNAF